ncbi:hypothetical protein KHA96_12075 [Bacillus sp. FJAT-49711]|uniref:NAD(P)-dependent oxidoreductase n=1 Tax=Bacillus sp. FJAT-49711 TaxID=2833585 RepID=UPI001BC9B34B|nr:NAD(P)-dependent oxidoreductase [Bacillus sp. FJAT-49711]MBS4219054.1 hypothetical protein [Bacillus sp. FJAT-49711]
MRTVLVVHPDFDEVWPFAADHFRKVMERLGEVEFYRIDDSDERSIVEIIPNPESVARLISLSVPVTSNDIQLFGSLKEAVITHGYGSQLSDECKEQLEQKGVRIYNQPGEGFWGQSVSEFALGLTICGLRRIPQTHHEIITSLDPWDYNPPENRGRPSAKGQQFGDNANFSNGTIQGKRVRIVGAGNIASRYASFVNFLGADVASWDPYASEPCFHRSGSRKEWHLEELVKDAEIFAPMVPLTKSTEGLITADHIRALPNGCLVILATRAGICDVPTLRERVLADELSLAADVFDIEPLPLNDPLLGRHNVVHTPHNAGRTIDANRLWADKLAEQFLPL